MLNEKRSCQGMFSYWKYFTDCFKGINAQNITTLEKKIVMHAYVLQFMQCVLCYM